MVTAPAAKPRLEAAAKRLLDIVGAAVLLAATAPLLLGIALLVRLTSPGPALFRQERLGRHRRPFVLYKFRSMAHNCSDAPHRAYVGRLLDSSSEAAEAAEPGRGGLFKLTDDPRLTPVGRFLRRTSLDELPQLWNVLKGEMSLVGPRPVLAYEADLYTPEMLARFAVPPGITGLWQVRGRSALSYRQMVDLDVEYARRWSLGLDLRILLATVGAVWRRDQAE